MNVSILYLKYEYGVRNENVSRTTPIVASRGAP